MRYNGEREDEILKKMKPIEKMGVRLIWLAYCFRSTKKLKKKIKMREEIKKNSRELICISDFFLNLLKIFHFTCQIQEELHLHNIKLNISIYIIKFNILTNKFKVYFIY